MTDQNPYQDIFDHIYTSEQKNMYVNAIQHALDASYDTTKNIMDVLDTYIPYNLTNLILDIVEEGHINLRDQSQASKFFEELLKEIQSLHAVDISLAFHPTYSQIKKIIAWWRSEIDPKAVLNITIQPELVAGAVIGYGGQLKDLSLQEGLRSILNT